MAGGQPSHRAVHHRGQRLDLAGRRLRVWDAHLDGAEPGMQTALPPELGVVEEGSRPSAPCQQFGKRRPSRRTRAPRPGVAAHPRASAGRWQDRCRVRRKTAPTPPGRRSAASARAACCRRPAAGQRREPRDGRARRRPTPRGAPPSGTAARWRRTGILVTPPAADRRPGVPRAPPAAPLRSARRPRGGDLQPDPPPPRRREDGCPIRSRSARAKAPDGTGHRPPGRSEPDRRPGSANRIGRPAAAPPRPRW